MFFADFTDFTDRMKAERMTVSFCRCGTDVPKFHGLNFYFCLFVVGRMIIPACYRNLLFIEALKWMERQQAGMMSSGG